MEPVVGRLSDTGPDMARAATRPCVQSTLLALWDRVESRVDTCLVPMQCTGTLRLLSPGKASSHKTALYRGFFFFLCSVFSCFHYTSGCEIYCCSTEEYGIFNVRRQLYCTAHRLQPVPFRLQGEVARQRPSRFIAKVAESPPVQCNSAQLH